MCVCVCLCVDLCVFLFVCLCLFECICASVYDMSLCVCVRSFVITCFVLSRAL